MSLLLLTPRQKLPFPALQMLSSLIELDHPQSFNIVDQLTGDNRALALRYLLTVGRTEPMNITEYPNAKILYVYSQVPVQQLLVHPVWEIASGRKYSVTGTWKITNGISLYKLEKH